jgi:hypothetical protein
MIEALLVVLSRPVAGRDDEFNDWYTNIHARDALRLDGVVATQRFRLAESQIRPADAAGISDYLALYEVSNAQRFMQGHFDAMLTPRMRCTTAFDRNHVSDYHYYLRAYRDRALKPRGACSAVMEMITVAPAEAEAFERWYADNVLSAALRQDGMSSGALLRYEPRDQLLKDVPEASHVAVYRLADDAARAHWADPAATRAPLDEKPRVAVTCWDTVTDRLVADDVRKPGTPEEKEEEAARDRMGDRYFQDAKMKSGTAEGTAADRPAPVPQT